MEKSIVRISDEAKEAGYRSPEVNAMKAFSLVNTTAHGLLNSTPVRLKPKKLSVKFDAAYVGPIDLLSEMCDRSEIDKEDFNGFKWKKKKKSFSKSYKVKFPSSEVTVCNKFYQSGKKLL